MTPLRAYRCSAGHEFEVVESMDGPQQTRCAQEALVAYRVCGECGESLVRVPDLDAMRCPACDLTYDMLHANSTTILRDEWGTCGRSLTPLIQHTQRPIVKRSV